MRINRRTFLLTVFAAACSRAHVDTPLHKAVRFLWSQQAADGGFHSATYGLLRSGQSLTPFVLDTLLDVPGAPPANVDRALGFIRKNTRPDGSLGRMDESAADYPNYATALALTAIVKAARPGWQQQITPMVAQLRAQQFSEANGWNPADMAFGGWGMGGDIRRPPDAGHVDLAMTRYVLEALHAAGVPATDAAMTRAQIYLKRSQNEDGGFYFSPVNPEINKAGESGEGFASYGTTTADGVLALRAAGVAEDDSRLTKAIAWLKSHHTPNRAPGFSGDREAWGQGLRFYYANAIKRAIPSLHVELPQQSEDGSYRNPNKLVKEDDPIIATTFALRVLASSYEN